jgi:hypothetical protein
LAVFALFSQAVIATLPMPNMVVPQDGMEPCHGHEPGMVPSSQPGKKTPLGTPICPVCQAGFLASSLLLSVPPAIVTDSIPGGWRVVVVASTTAPFSRGFHPQQARAPPSLN